MERSAGPGAGTRADAGAAGTAAESAGKTQSGGVTRNGTRDGGKTQRANHRAGTFDRGVGGGEGGCTGKPGRSGAEFVGDARERVECGAGGFGVEDPRVHGCGARGHAEQRLAKSDEYGKEGGGIVAGVGGRAVGEAARGAQGCTEKRKRDGNTPTRSGQAPFTERRTQRSQRRVEKQRAAEGALHWGRPIARACGRDETETRRPRNGSVLRSGLHDYGMDVFDVRIVNLIRVELHVAFQLQIQR